MVKLQYLNSTLIQDKEKLQISLITRVYHKFSLTCKVLVCIQLEEKSVWHVGKKKNKHAKDKAQQFERKNKKQKKKRKAKI